VGYVPGTLPRLREFDESLTLGDYYEIPRLPVLRRGRTPSGFQDLIEMITRNGPIFERPDVPAGSDCLPRLHLLAFARATGG
jgi:hypothetical protein